MTTQMMLQMRYLTTCLGTDEDPEGEVNLQHGYGRQPPQVAVLIDRETLGCNHTKP